MISQPARFKPYRPRRARGRPFPSRAKENPPRGAGAGGSRAEVRVGNGRHAGGGGPRARRARGRPAPARADEPPGGGAGAEVSLPKFSLGTVRQNEGDGQVHLVAGDLAVLDQDVLVLDPGALYTTEGGGGTTDGLIDGIFET